MTAADRPDREPVLSEAEREGLAEYVKDALTFGIGASTEALMELRDDGPTEWAREFAAARNPIEVERILATHVARAREEGRAEALRRAADALEGGLGIEGSPRNLWEFRQWLRARADAQTSDGSGG